MVYVSIMYPILITSLWNLEAVRHTTFAVELGRKVKLPRLERCLITGGDDTFELILQWLITKLVLVGRRIESSLLHIGITEGGGHGPSAQDLHGSLHLPIVREVLRPLYIAHII